MYIFLDLEQKSKMSLWIPLGAVNNVAFFISIDEQLK